MKKYTLFGILIALLCILLFVVFYLLWEFRASANSLPRFTHDENTSTALIKQENDENAWQRELSQWTTKDFVPAAEQYSLYFDADTSELKEKNQYFQLIVNKYDIYSMFCLRQILNSFNVKYFLVKSGESPEIFIDTGNKKLIDEIIQELKKYKINTQAKEIWL
ncbi:MULTISPECIES: hypothetical protein [unclassified Campylobacter]|uniref:hypothetical protein n=1 Tax=unclassified Campylobacter TaxID=2593542 RepID=UPI0012382EC3|nr:MULTISPECIES: hypothetical protein [unclassified Campylobacter]KAA6224815.1 hypothetical protein FMM54_07205 [Campylobacter sp. LR185c]KAA6227390.1 hypothetical protein FMM55_03350 [Campylobacter sp. LR196d]KAA6228767.1 hypothetical protein FMM57_02565 [Campylobacter sp. LR286c]KAA6229577.1 hypothetical protein FMM56_08520 [Campylobacter sp. LR264d]KAA6230821.1 hypothetical protein FMM58_05275 [Campylobacter sp. LR291e]